jgi:hypothetical protein
MYVCYGDEDSYKKELEEILIKEAKKAEEEREQRRLEQLAKSKE